MKRTFTPRLIRSACVVAVGSLAATATAQGIAIGPAATPFTDISVSGNSPGPPGDDTEHTVTATTLSAAGWAGNELLPVTDIRIGNNGAVLINPLASTQVGYINSTILPTMAASNLVDTGNGGTTIGTSLLCPLWDDNVPVAGLGSYKWQVIGGNLIIQWTAQDHFNAIGTGDITYQLIAYGGATIASGRALVDFVYQDTLYAINQYQDDGGSATIGYKNWGANSLANDVEYGIGGGNNTINDPAFGDPSMQPKVGGYLESNDPGGMLPRALTIFGVIPPPFVYCTAKVNSLGCVPSISAIGIPSSGGGVPFIVSTINVINNKPGLYLYTSSGPAAIPFAGGILCLAPSLKRAIPMISGGNPPPNDCSGIYALDFNAFAIGALGGTPASYLLIPGTRINVQCWGRDNGYSAPNNATLSDAIQYVVH